ncbi:hypothetical protein FCIRC_12429 [Fusarium circinatum]|uniref:Uncharacterized protein n=1 Tax=Fusarium circinatum TaxID=48490 RepID=A0A8H5SY00_FUSCI|nr:hypothetical protein FCIRC_12429 [Fusarium circinatum]
MSVPEERYRRRAITRSKNWTIKDALHALDEEFWCRNVANNPKDFVAGVSHPLEDDPGYQFWLELKGEIRQYFHIAADSPDKKGSHHPMTRKTIDAALTAIDAFYGDRVVDVDGEQVPWEEAIPRRAEWIVDRFCSPFQGWNPILSNAASILGLNQWLDIMVPATETEIRPSIQEVDGHTQGDIQGDGSGDDLSEDGDSIKDEHMSVKNDDGLAKLKKELEDQSEKVEELNSKVKRLEEEDANKQKGLEELNSKVKRLEEENGSRQEDLVELNIIVKHLEEENGSRQADLEGLEEDQEVLQEDLEVLQEDLEVLQKESKWHYRQFGQLEGTVTDLQAEVDQFKKEREEARKLMKTSMDEINRSKPSVLHQSPTGESSVITTDDMDIESIEDLFGDETKPTTTQPSHSKTATSTPKPRDPPCATARGRSGSASLAPSGLFAPLTASPLDGGQASLKREASAQTSPTPTRTFTVGGRNNSQRSSNRRSPLTNHPFSKTDPLLKEHLLRKRRRHKEPSEEEKTSEETPKQDGK